MPVGGSSSPAVSEPAAEPKPAAEGFRGPDPPSVGHDHPQLHPGDRPHPDPSFRSSGGLQGEGCSRGPRSDTWPSTASTAPVSKSPEGCCFFLKSVRPAGCANTGACFYWLPPSPFVGSKVPLGPRFGKPRRLWLSGPCPYKPTPLPCDAANELHLACAAGPVRLGGHLPERLGPCSNSSLPKDKEPSSARCPLSRGAALHVPAGPFEGDPGLPSAPSTTPPLLSFRAFGLSLAARIGRTRGSFGAFVVSTLHLLQELPPAPAQVLFPLPTPFPGCFQHVPPSKGSRVRSRVAVRRVVHVAVMACNFLFSGCRVPCLKSLRRRPNRSQARAISYIAKLCRACGAVEPFSVSSAGRRSAQLHASLGELSEHLTWIGPGIDPYGPLFHGAAPSLHATDDQPRPGAGGLQKPCKFRVCCSVACQDWALTPLLWPRRGPS